MSKLDEWASRFVAAMLIYLLALVCVAFTILAWKVVLR